MAWESQMTRKFARVTGFEPLVAVEHQQADIQKALQLRQEYQQRQQETREADLESDNKKRKKRR
jgi:hypothetical protein